MPAPEPRVDPAARDIAAMDEILQVMYWLRGEKLAAEVTAQGLTRWLGLDAGAIASLLLRMAGRGWVEARGGPEGSYALTPRGVREGGRRFADEFAELTRPGHGECGDPDCECQRTGRLEDCQHHRAAGQSPGSRPGRTADHDP